VDVLLVVDMQEGLLRGALKHDLLAVVERINRLAVRVRRRGGSVVFVQHAGPVGDDFEPLTPGWHLLPTITTEPGDRIVSKTLNDAFFKTSLQSDLAELSMPTETPDLPPLEAGTPALGDHPRGGTKRQ
jgi:nicotinamidase-related amidase